LSQHLRRKIQLRKIKAIVSKTITAIALIFSGMDLAAAAGADSSPPPVAPERVCAGGQVVPRTLVNRLLDLYEPTFEPEEALRDLADAQLRLEAEQRHPSLLRILADTKDMLNGRWKKQFQPRSDGTVSAEQYFENPAIDPIFCASNATSTAAPASAEFRLRGTPDDLTYRKGDDGFTGASKASLSFSDNGVNKTRTDQLQGTAGYAVPIGTDTNYTAIPYAGTNRNVSNKAGKSAKIGVETVDIGTVAVLKDIPFSGATVSLTPDYLLNLQDHSRLATGHAIFAPHFVGLLNNPANLGIVFTACTSQDQANCASWPYFTLLADIRSDVGAYTDRGIASARAANQDFSRLGTKFGFDLFLKNWIDLAVTHTYLHGFSGSGKTLNDFQSSLSFYFGTQNVLGLTVAYKNGLLEQTAQREQSWTVGLTAKY
jgi:hypothetical protein